MRSFKKTLRMWPTSFENGRRKQIRTNTVSIKATTRRMTEVTTTRIKRLENDRCSKWWTIVYLAQKKISVGSTLTVYPTRNTLQGLSRSYKN